MTITDTDAVTLLQGAFVPGYRGPDGNRPAQVRAGMLSSTTRGGTLLLGTTDERNAEHAIPLDIAKLASGIAALARRPDPLKRPDEVDRDEWRTMDDDDRARAVSDDLRPQGTSPRQWRALTPAERAATAMHAKCEEWDWRGGLSDMKPAGVSRADLDAVARVMISLGEGEIERLIRIARTAVR